MHVLGDLGTDDFLRLHWQRAPLLVRGALADAVSSVDARAIVDLACETGCESRLILHDDETAGWSCEYGPFEPARFDALPPSGWTLLVQGVDAWLPEVAALLDRFDFLPRWRLDDVMVSLAARGGGVGPHFDWYDVFLVQARGTREWQIGPRCDAGTALREHPDLRLLPGFEPVAEHRLAPGDLLYLPAGIAHRGTALDDDCVTCSIGFRAPANLEIAAAMVDQLAPLHGEDRRYRDPPEGIDEDPFLINAAVVAELGRIWNDVDPGAIESALARAFGTLVTAAREPRGVDGDDAPHEPDLDALARAGAPIVLGHHASSRFAYRIAGDGAELYVDGAVHATSEALAKGICRGRIPASALRDAGARELVRALIVYGSIEIVPGRARS